VGRQSGAILNHPYTLRSRKDIWIKMSNSIFLIVDYRGHFYPSTRFKGASLNVETLKDYFKQYGYSLEVKTFIDIDFRSQNFRGQYILYQSSEDRDSLYKGYIEDILLGLQIQGAILIPDFFQFHAHNNKVFMEILRDISVHPGVKGIQSKGYGTLEDFVKDAKRWKGDIVMKPSSGAMSQGVKSLSTYSARINHAKMLSNSFNLIDATKYFLKQYIRQDYRRESIHRRKFIVQNLIDHIPFDFKILVYGDKYYLLRRNNRKNDFRASGSGLFEWIENPPEYLLDYAESVFKSFHCPFISLDVARGDNEFYLFEFQFLRFGQLTLEKSSYYFQKQADKWVLVHETPILEREVALSVAEYIEKLSNPSITS
jgi:hypothetical protein